MVDQVSESYGAVECGGLVGYYVGKDGSFGTGSDILGKVASYNGDTKLYTVVYENRDNEDLDHRELRDILMVGDGGSGMKLSCRKRKLDQLVPSPLAYKGPNTRSKKNPREMVPNGAPKAPPLTSQLSLDSSDDADSTMDSINHDSSLLQESVMPSLPPSSGDLSVPEDSAPNLFSVYNFLRSFSLQLFLSPFGLHEFVGALNCAAQNSLMDAVHVSLMQALRRHLEMLSSEGSVLASQCLRRHDWTLLDTLTWSTLLVEYLYIMGFMKGLQKEGFSADDLQREYYCLHVATKLKVLQILCDAIIDSAELRAVLEMRDDMEEEKEYNVDASGPPENVPMRVHPRHSKTSAWKNMQALESSDENKKLIPISTVMELGTDATDASPDENTDECVLCGMDGTLICCDGCPSAYHSRCIGLNKASLPAGLWYCPECVVNKLGPTSLRIGRGTSGAEVFGVDIYERLFVGTCNYLLVTETSPDANSASRYYNQDDVVKVLGVICATGELLSAYEDICKGISKYWEIPLIMQNGKAENVGNSHGYVSLSFASDTNKLFFKDNKENYSPEDDGSGARVKDSDLDQVDIQDSQKYASEYHDNKMKTEAIDGASIQLNNVGPTGDASRIDQKTLPFVSISASSESQSWRLTDKHIRDKSWIDLTLFKSHAYSNQYVLGDVAASAAANLAILASEERKVPEAQASSNPKKVLAANTAIQVKAFSRAAINFLWPSHERKQMEAPRERCGWCIACKGSSVNKRGCLLNLAASCAIKRFTRSMSVPSIKQDGSHLHAIATHITNMEESLRGLIVGPFLDANFIQQWRNQIRQARYKDLKSAILELEKKIRAIAFSRDWIKMVDDWPSLESSAAQTGNGTGPNQKHGSVGRRSKRQSVTSEFAEAYNESKDYVQWWRGASLSKLVFQKGVLPSSLVKKAARQGGRRRITGVSYTECPEFPRRNRQFAWRAAVEMSKNASQLALQVRYLDAHLRWRDLVRPDPNPLEGKGSDADATIFRNAHLCDKMLAENRIQYSINFANQKHLPSRVLKNVLDSERIEDGSDKLWFSEKHVPLFLIKEFEEKAIVKSGLRCLTKSKERHPKSYSSDIFSYLLIKLEKPSKLSCTCCQVDVLLRNAVRCNTCQGYCHEDCVVSSTIHKDGDLKFLFTCNPCHPAKCASCHVDVPIRDAVKCSTCQGNCHKGCMVSLTVNKDGNLESMFMCNPCYHAKTAMIAKSHQEVLNRQLSSSEQGQQPIGIKCVLRLRSQKNSQKKGKALDSCTERKARDRGGLSRTYGLIWKKNRKDESDFDRNFLVDNIIFKGKEGMESLIKPTCRLCHSEYRSDLMYVRCQTCQYWFHADALNLLESQVFELLGFKCCRCRKIASPKCPYLELGHKELDLGYLIQRNAGRSEIATSELARSRRRQPRGKDLVMLDDSLSIGIKQLAYSSIEVSESKPEDSGVVVDDPLLQSLGRVEAINRRLAIEAQPNEPEIAVRSQQKLSVRRPQQTRRSDGNGNAQLEQDNSNTYGYEKEGLDPDRGNIEGVEYKFSFTDLLSSEDEKMDNGFEFSLDTSTNGLDDMKPAVACGRCNLELPSADLMCEICGLCIHSRCSPWVESNEEPGGATKWRCGECREWR